MSSVIAIDGPTSSGKNSVAHLFAKKIGYMHFDSGDIYRVFSLAVLNAGVEKNDDQKIDEVLGSIKVKFIDEGEGKWSLNGEDVTERLHEPEVTKIVPDIANKAFVRKYADKIQRELSSGQNTVVTGRDIGTVVFPDAQIKFYLTASLEIRAKRRFEQFKKRGLETTYEDVLKSLSERDMKDMTRELSPLKEALDAVIIDTTNLTTEESVEKFMEEFNKHVSN